MAWDRGTRPGPVQMAAPRAFALTLSSSQFFGTAVDSANGEAGARSVDVVDAARKASSFTFDGLVKPLITRTNCSRGVDLLP